MSIMDEAPRKMARVKRSWSEIMVAMYEQDPEEVGRGRELCTVLGQHHGVENCTERHCLCARESPY